MQYLSYTTFFSITFSLIKNQANLLHADIRELEK